MAGQVTLRTTLDGFVVNNAGRQDGTEAMHCRMFPMKGKATLGPPAYSWNSKRSNISQVGVLSAYNMVQVHCNVFRVDGEQEHVSESALKDNLFWLHDIMHGTIL